MGRTYASIMALMAMLVVLLRALKNHAGMLEAIPLALAWMGLFGGIGLVLGLIARHTVDHSVLKLVEQELERLAPAANDQPPQNHA